MAISAPRDPELTEKKLTEWLAGRLSDARDLTLSNLELPPSGNSNETLYFDARWTETGEAHHERLVARVQPDNFQIFLDADVMLQYRMMEALAAHSAVPVPQLRWAETDRSVLGSPFFIMERVDGRVLLEVPSYQKSGWAVDLTPAEREQLWLSAMEAFSLIPRLDWTNGFDFLAEGTADSYLDRYLEWVRAWYTWAGRGRHRPITDAAMEYVLSHRPGQSSCGVIWGDARVGNMIFTETADVAAVIDWEMAALGPPEIDLGWWLFFDRFMTDGMGVSRLDGFPDREDTISHYETLTGLGTSDLEYYEILAALRMATVIIRTGEMRVEQGVFDDATGFTTQNPVTQLLARHLGLPVPELAPQFQAVVAQREASVERAPG
jgi:aminoglycoside phosphotransferase (APT) family kinase protein